MSSNLPQQKSSSAAMIKERGPKRLMGNPDKTVPADLRNDISQGFQKHVAFALWEPIFCIASWRSSKRKWSISLVFFSCCLKHASWASIQHIYVLCTLFFAEQKSCASSSLNRLTVCLWVKAIFLLCSCFAKHDETFSPCFICIQK